MIYIIYMIAYGTLAIGVFLGMLFFVKNVTNVKGNKILNKIYEIFFE